MKRKDCFAYIEKDGNPSCNCLTKMQCKDCSFYKKSIEIKDNPFYAFSYKDKRKLAHDLKKYQINESQIVN